MSDRPAPDPRFVIDNKIARTHGRGMSLSISLEVRRRQKPLVSNEIFYCRNESAPFRPLSYTYDDRRRGITAFRACHYCISTRFTISSRLFLNHEGNHCKDPAQKRVSKELICNSVFDVLYVAENNLSDERRVLSENS